MAPFGVLATGFIGLLIFIYGFLPLKIMERKDEGDQPLPVVINGIRVNSSLLYKPVINRLVLLVIDALREDFVTGSESSLHMPYFSSVIRHGEGILFTSLVEPPTVTLPRIKAITMGTIPNYADVILNVLEKDASGLKEESIVGRASSSHLKIIFYGDDTWLRLFPQLFLRAEGTSSFYVSDFTEVDNNVTRHLDQELKKDDWDIMILHYLGLDHIGHIHGPYSQLVPQKLTEMDLIIQKLHQGLTKWGSSTLLVVCGDHGMKDTGGHGGATHPETHVPLAFISPMLSQSHGCIRESNNEDMVINQRDLAPTLSALLGLPPPSGNLGCALPSVLRCFLPDPAALLYALHVNAWQVAGLLNSPGAFKTDGYFMYEESTKLHSEWIISEGKGIEGGCAYKDKECSSKLTERIVQLYSVSVSELTSKFAETLIKFDYYAMFLGGFITWQAFLILFVNGKSSMKGHYTKVLMLAILMFVLHIVFCATGICFSSSFCKLDLFTFMLVITMVVMSSFNICIILHKAGFFTTYNVKEMWEEVIKCRVHCLFIIGGFLHAVSLASSSFIEEEHQTWQFLCVSLIILLGALTCHDLHVESRSNGEKTVLLSYSPESKKQCNFTITDVISKRLEKSIRLKKSHSSDALYYPECDFQSTGDHIYNQDKEMCELVEPSPLKSQCHKRQELDVSSNQNEYLEIHTKKNWFKFSWTFALLLFTHRLLRDWNHTGDKWGNLPDIADWISKPENIIVSSVMMASSLVGLVFVLLESDVLYPCLENMFLSSLSALCIFAYRVAVGDVSVFFPYPSSRGIIEFKMFMFFLTLLLANGFYKAYKILISGKAMESRDNSPTMEKAQVIGDEMVKLSALAVVTQHLSTVWILFCTILKRPCDVPVVVIYILSCYILTDASTKKATPRQSTANVILLSFTYIWLGMVFYFHQGNSNSLASIDLQAGYVGQENYNSITVGLLLFCHTFTMPITSLVLLFHSLVTATTRSRHFNPEFFKKSLSTAGKCVAFARLLPVVIYLPIVTIQRHHLFIWTVFTPKLIYEAILTMAALFGLAFISILDFYNITI